jgi:hypothetical protein
MPPRTDYIPKVTIDELRQSLAREDDGRDKTLEKLMWFSTPSSFCTCPHLARQSYIKYSFAILTQEVLDWIVGYCGRNSIDTVVEIGSGTGLLVALLMHPQTQDAMRAEYGFATDFVATDPFLTHGRTEETTLAPVDKLTAMEAVEKHKPIEALMSVWPNYNGSFATDALKAVTNTCKHFMLIGEDKGGCTGDSHLYDLLDEDWQTDEANDLFPAARWEGLHDYGRWYTKDQDVVSAAEIAALTL